MEFSVSLLSPTAPKFADTAAAVPPPEPAVTRKTCRVYDKALGAMFSLFELGFPTLFTPLLAVQFHFLIVPIKPYYNRRRSLQKPSLRNFSARSDPQRSIFSGAPIHFVVRFRNSSSLVARQCFTRELFFRTNRRVRPEFTAMLASESRGGGSV
jgi:hypothetical protein